MTTEELDQQIAFHEANKATFEFWLANAGDTPNNYQTQIDSEANILASLYEARLRLEDTLRETPNALDGEP